MKSCSVPELGFDVDETVMTVNDSHDGGQAQTRTLPEGFGGEEGVENFIHQFGRNPRASVGHAENDVRTGLGLGIDAHRFTFDLRAADANGERAAFRHGVAGVHAKVQQHLLNLRGIAVEQRRILADTCLRVNGLGESLARDAFDFRNQMLGLQRYSGTFCAPRKGEHLFHNVGAALRTSFERLHPGARAFILRFLFEEMNRHHDRRENVV